MPSGDAQLAWFPEMLVELEAFWTPEVSWDALIEFCTRMTAVRSEDPKDERNPISDDVLRFLQTTTSLKTSRYLSSFGLIRATETGNGF